MQTFLIVSLMLLIPSLTAALIAIALRPRRKDDVMQQAVGDAPGILPDRPWPRGGYAAMDERAPIERERG
jgi:hypothetical protein